MISIKHIFTDRCLVWFFCRCFTLQTCLLSNSLYGQFIYLLPGEWCEKTLGLNCQQAAYVSSWTALGHERSEALGQVCMYFCVSWIYAEQLGGVSRLVCTGIQLLLSFPAAIEEVRKHTLSLFNHLPPFPPLFLWPLLAMVRADGRRFIQHLAASTPAWGPVPLVVLSSFSSYLSSLPSFTLSPPHLDLWFVSSFPFLSVLKPSFTDLPWVLIRLWPAPGITSHLSSVCFACPVIPYSPHPPRKEAK